MVLLILHYLNLKQKKERQCEIADLIGGGFEEASDYALTLIDKAAA